MKPSFRLVMLVSLVQGILAAEEYPCDKVDIEMFCLKDTWSAKYFKTAEVYSDAKSWCFPHIPEDGKGCSLKEAEVHDLFQKSQSTAEYKMMHDQAAMKCAMCVASSCVKGGKACVAPVFHKLPTPKPTLAASASCCKPCDVGKYGSKFAVSDSCKKCPRGQYAGDQPSPCRACGKGKYSAIFGGKNKVVSVTAAFRCYKAKKFKPMGGYEKVKNKVLGEEEEEEEEKEKEEASSPSPPAASPPASAPRPTPPPPTPAPAPVSDPTHEPTRKPTAPPMAPPTRAMQPTPAMTLGASPACCKKCAEGFFSNKFARAGSCKLCPLGQYADSLPNPCKKCGKGKKSAIFRDGHLLTTEAAYKCYKEKKFVGGYRSIPMGGGGVGGGPPPSKSASSHPAPTPPAPAQATLAPTARETRKPTPRPTKIPTAHPTKAPPTVSPTPFPTDAPTKVPTAAPTTPAPTAPPTPRMTLEAAPRCCKICQEGFYSIKFHKTDRCKGCPLGQYADSVSNPCKKCSAGKHSAIFRDGHLVTTEAAFRCYKESKFEGGYHSLPMLPGGREAPTIAPTSAPTREPTPATSAPTHYPTMSPTREATEPPTKYPTGRPTAAPTEAKTAPPTKYPTSRPTGAPSAHPCDDGSHNCDKGEGGVCYKSKDGSSGYRCGCKDYDTEMYYCKSGCFAPYEHHACALVTPSPTRNPTTPPPTTKAPTPPPTKGVTLPPAPSCCTKCAEGTFASRIERTQNCKCPRGRYPSSARNPCRHCPKGKYSGVFHGKTLLSRSAAYKCYKKQHFPAPPTPAKPTNAPTYPPTRVPTRGPTFPPTNAPSPTPTHTPTSAPTPPPSPAPTPYPTPPPTPAPTAGPTHAPTPAPTPHPCVDGTNSCHPGAGGVCYRAKDGGSGYTCGCENMFRCEKGCRPPYKDHTCTKITSFPTNYPTALPTTPAPTTAAPTPMMTHAKAPLCCRVCKTGFYSPKFHRTKDCNTCELGQYSFRLANPCRKCPSGKHSGIFEKGLIITTEAAFKCYKEKRFPGGYKEIPLVAPPTPVPTLPTSQPTRNPTAKPTLNPTLSPSPVPTTAPTLHACDNDSHHCDREGGICYKSKDGSSDYTCGCKETFICVEGCQEPFKDHECKKETSAPTFSPTSTPTQAPTTAPTPPPTIAPTLAPTPHPCDDGSHNCDHGEGGICYKSKDGTNDYTCGCTRGIYYCTIGCKAPYKDHACALVTVNPTPSPTMEPTKSPTGEVTSPPTLSPTLAPTPHPCEDGTHNCDHGEGGICYKAKDGTNGYTCGCKDIYWCTHGCKAPYKDHACALVTPAPTLSPTMEPTKSPTGEVTSPPTLSPTLAPTPHPCEDGTHNCDHSKGGICYKAKDGTNGYTCGCKDLYWCTKGCQAPYKKHACTLVTPAPTPAPTATPIVAKSPIQKPTAAPTPSPTAAAHAHASTARKPTTSPTHTPTAAPTAPAPKKKAPAPSKNPTPCAVPSSSNEDNYPCEKTDVEMFCLKDTWSARYYKSADVYHDAEKWCFPHISPKGYDCLLTEKEVHDIFEKSQSTDEYKAMHDNAAMKCAMCVAAACVKAGEPCVAPVFHTIPTPKPTLLASATCCKFCELGKYASKFAVSTKCKKCPRGQYAEDAPSPCRQCPKGKYSAIMGGKGNIVQLNGAYKCYKAKKFTKLGGYEAVKKSFAEEEEGGSEGESEEASEPTPAPGPTHTPTRAPSKFPTTTPTWAPTPYPSRYPTPAPTPPSAAPTAHPTLSPTIAPTPAPTLSPTLSPTLVNMATSKLALQKELAAMESGSLQASPACCKPCKDGQFNFRFARSAKCSRCPRGQYASDIPDPCLPCPKGKYSGVFRSKSQLITTEAAFRCYKESKFVGGWKSKKLGGGSNKISPTAAPTPKAKGHGLFGMNGFKFEMPTIERAPHKLHVQPTRVPVAAPTAHPCDDGSHNCDKGEGGVCYKSKDGGNSYSCACKEMYWCTQSCGSPYKHHSCELSSTAPTPAVAQEKFEMPIIEKVPHRVTGYPTTSPTLAPTPHPCEDGTHNCNHGEGGICYKAKDGTNGYTCGCKDIYWCTHGCKAPYKDHACALVTPAPTLSPTKAPTNIPTVKVTQPTTSAPTPSPTLVPTLAPTPHPCEDGTHNCDHSKGGICYKAKDGTNGYTCGCKDLYWCTKGCQAPYKKHACTLVTPAPTPAPTKAPNLTPTAKPTLAPTLSPTLAPTPAPTQHPCEDGSHDCHHGPGGICFAANDGSSGYACGCKDLYWCTFGCKPPYKGHVCTLITPAPTLAPSSAPTIVTHTPTPTPTAAPTPAPTRAPTDAPTATPTRTPGPTVAPTQAPTTAPTPPPTIAPTLAPTPHPCDDGSHNCDHGAGGICYKARDGSSDYYCGCKFLFWCTYGCDEPYNGHACAVVTPAPTPAPTTPAPTAKRVVPTPIPTLVPTPRPCQDGSHNCHHGPGGICYVAKDGSSDYTCGCEHMYYCSYGCEPPFRDHVCTLVTPAPTPAPTAAIDASTTHAPTHKPTRAPTHAPTKVPTLAPSAAPTQLVATPTAPPTLSPTKAPTPHPCNDGSHNCDHGPGGICYAAADGSSTYTCGCESLYWCSYGCQPPFHDHVCTLRTPAPTPAPTRKPTPGATTAPTTSPTKAPTPHPCNDGSHNCHHGPGGICYAAADGSKAYTCGCESLYWCSYGCQPPFHDHVCTLRTPAPTMAPSAAPSPGATIAPTTSPTKAPTPHPCNDGSHNCHHGPGGICYAAADGSKAYTCGCESLYWCSHGCEVPFAGHACTLVTPAPTFAPTALPTKLTTPQPTPAPTKAPTATPTAVPTKAPTKQPTALVTASPTKAPTIWGHYPCKKVDIEMFCLKNTWSAKFFTRTSVYDHAQTHCFPKIPTKGHKCEISEAQVHSVFEEDQSGSGEYTAWQNKMAHKCAVCIVEACKVKSFFGVVTHSCVDPSEFEHGPTLSPTGAPTPKPTLHSAPECCKKCPEGQYASKLARSANCDNCPRGQYAMDAPSPCEVCPHGRFSAVFSETGEVISRNAAYKCYFVTAAPSPAPTRAPTPAPTAAPTPAPSERNTRAPTRTPTPLAPTTKATPAPTFAKFKKSPEELFGEILKRMHLEEEDGALLKRIGGDMESNAAVGDLTALDGEILKKMHREEVRRERRAHSRVPTLAPLTSDPTPVPPTAAPTPAPPTAAPTPQYAFRFRPVSDTQPLSDRSGGGGTGGLTQKAASDLDLLRDMDAFGGSGMGAVDSATAATTPPTTAPPTTAPPTSTPAPTPAAALLAGEILKKMHKQHTPTAPPTAPPTEPPATAPPTPVPTLVPPTPSPTPSSVLTKAYGAWEERLRKVAGMREEGTAGSGTHEHGGAAKSGQPLILSAPHALATKNTKAQAQQQVSVTMSADEPIVVSRPHAVGAVSGMSAVSSGVTADDRTELTQLRSGLRRHGSIGRNSGMEGISSSSSKSKSKSKSKSNRLGSSRHSGQKMQNVLELSPTKHVNANTADADDATGVDKGEEETGGVASGHKKAKKKALQDELASLRNSMVQVLGVEADLAKEVDQPTANSHMRPV